jgi:hypothetical protein
MTPASETVFHLLAPHQYRALCVDACSAKVAAYSMFILQSHDATVTLYRLLPSSCHGAAACPTWLQPWPR